MNTNDILITRPMRTGDPTEYTYQWGEEIANMVKKYGHHLIDIKKNDVTYINVCNALQKYHPRIYIHIGHGCPASIQGQKECIVTRRFGVDELLAMPNFREIVMPLTYASGCQNGCMTMPDICSPFCTNDTNVSLLKGCIVITVACYSALQLGKCAVRYGADAYIGYDDLMLFPVDDVGSQNMFKDVHITFIKAILEGKTIEEANNKMMAHEDNLIRFHKKTKFIALPLLWNKTHRKILGNSNLTIND